MPYYEREKPLFVVGHEAKRSARHSVRKKRTGTYVPYYEREKPLFVVGHGAKRSARHSVRKKRTGTYVPYYERERPLFVVGHEAKCPFQVFPSIRVQDPPSFRPRKKAR